MTHQHATLEDTVYLYFAVNDTSGSGNDGATPLFDVRLGGAAASAAPVLSGTPALLTHANYGPGLHEVAVAATAANGFVAGNTYGVFATITADSQTPAGFIGSFTLGPVIANVTEMAANVLTAAAIASGAFTASKFGTNFITSGSIATGAINADGMAADAIGSSELATTAINAIRDAILADGTAFNGGSIAAILADSNELQIDWVNGGRLDLLIDAIKAVTDNLPDSGALTSLATAAALAVVDGIVDDLKSGIIFGAAQTGTLAIGSMTTDLTGYGDDQIIGRVVTFLGGAAEGEIANISDYASASGLITFASNLTTAPGNGDPFKVT